MTSKKVLSYEIQDLQDDVREIKAFCEDLLFDREGTTLDEYYLARQGVKLKLSRSQIKARQVTGFIKVIEGVYSKMEVSNEPVRL